MLSLYAVKNNNVAGTNLVEQRAPPLERDGRGSDIGRALQADGRRSLTLSGDRAAKAGASVYEVANIRLRQAKARRLVNDLALLGRGLERRHAALR